MFIELYKEERKIVIGEKNDKAIKIAKLNGYKSLEELEAEKVKAKPKAAPKKRAPKKKKEEK